MLSNSISSKVAKTVVIGAAAVVLLLSLYYISAEGENTPVRYKFTGCVVSVCVDTGTDTRCLVVPPMVGKVTVEEDSSTKHQTIMVAQVKDMCY